MAASKASAKVDSPDTRLACLQTEADTPDHEACEPQVGLLKVDFCHQPRDHICGLVGDEFNLVREEGSNALVS